jgi:phosphoribosylanthranilate isomerase
VLVKICGITNLTDARAAVDAGATALGFNFYASSPRCITPSLAEDIARQLPSTVLKVGLFVEHSPENVKSILNGAGLDVAQVYFDEPIPGVRHWRTRRVDGAFDSDGLEDESAEAFLLDTPSATLRGGTGQTFDWRRARNPRVRIIIAGGLDASNVRQAIEEAQPWGVDACSRLESEPGRKDAFKMKQFIQAALTA